MDRPGGVARAPRAAPRCAACPRSSTAGSTRAACPSPSGASRTCRVRASSSTTRFPADFISEAIDQTRGWFYSLLDDLDVGVRRETQDKLGLTPRAFPHPYKSCIVLGHVCDREGKKESKSRATTRRRRSSWTGCAWTSACSPRPTARAASRGSADRRARTLEGMDLPRATRRSVVYRADAPPRRSSSSRSRRSKKLPRRVVVLVPRADTAALGVTPISNGLDTMPVEVPRAAARRARDDRGREHARRRAPTRSAGSSTRPARRGPTRATACQNVRTAAEGLPRQAAQRLLVLHHLREHRRLAPDERRARRSARGRTRLARPLDALGARTSRCATCGRALDAYLVYDAAHAPGRSGRGALELVRAPQPRRASGRPGLEADKRDAYATLYTALSHHRRADRAVHAVLRRGDVPEPGRRAPASQGPRERALRRTIPRPTRRAIDERLASRHGRGARDRQPRLQRAHRRTSSRCASRSSRADVVFNDGELPERLASLHASSIAEELNVHEVRLHVPGTRAGRGDASSSSRTSARSGRASASTCKR